MTEKVRAGTRAATTWVAGFHPELPAAPVGLDIFEEWPRVALGNGSPNVRRSEDQSFRICDAEAVAASDAGRECEGNEHAEAYAANVRLPPSADVGKVRFRVTRPEAKSGIC